MQHHAFRVIHDDHRGIAAMLSSALLLLAQHRRDGTLPPFDALRAMLFYLDEFPERLHHRKESELLFPMIRARCNEATAALNQLDQDHALGEKAIRELEHSLIAYEMLGTARASAFEQALDRYARFYREHMALEEEVVLPLALKVLDDADWDRLNAAFSANATADPRPSPGSPAAQPYEQLFQHIARITPAPIGLG